MAVFINPVTGQEFEGFSWRKNFNRAKDAAGFTPIGLAVRHHPLSDLAQKGMQKNRFLRRLMFDGVPVDNFEGEFDGFSEADPGYEHFLKKAFKRKEGGTFAGNLLRGVAQQAKTMIPGGSMLPIGEGLMMKKPQIQAAPAEAVAMAQTPAQAAEVVSAIAPNLKGPVLQTAINAVQQSNTPETAIRTATNLAAINDAKGKEDGKKKTALLIGGGIFSALVVALIVYLIVRK